MSMSSIEAPRPGDTVNFTTYGRKGHRTGTLNGYLQGPTGFGLLAYVRLDNGSVVSVSAERVSAR
jgi:hypothetical protein